MNKYSSGEILWSRNFILACVANFLMAFAFFLLIPTLPIYLTGVLNLDDSKVGVVLSSYTLAMLITRFFSGYLVDNMSRKLLLMISLAVFSLLFGMYAFAATVGIFVLIRSFHGIAWGLTTLSSGTIAIDIIPAARRAEGIGYYGINMNIAMASAPWVGLKIYESAGYNNLILSCVGISLCSLSLSGLIKTEPRKRIEQTKIPFSLDRFVLTPALPIMFNLLLCAVPHGMLLSYGVLYGNEIDIRNPGTLFLFLALGIGLSRGAAGKLVDRGHRHTVLFWSIALLGISYGCFGLFRNVYVFCGSALFAGLGFGCLITAFQTVFVNMARNTRRGTANSTYLISFDLGISLGMLTGGIVSQIYDLATAYIIGACLCAIALPYYRFISQRIYETKKVI